MKMLRAECVNVNRHCERSAAIPSRAGNPGLPRVARPGDWSSVDVIVL